jgi:hypothetical protein
VEKKTNSPLVLGWLSNASVHNDLPVVATSTVTTTVHSKNTHMMVPCNDNWSNRTSKRTKKLPKTRTIFMANINFKDSNDSSSPPSTNSIRNKMNNNISLNKTSQDYIIRNAFKKSSSLLIYHQNIRGIHK